MTAPTPPAARDAGVGERVSVPIAASAEADRLRLALSYYHNWDSYDFGPAEGDIAELGEAARLALGAIDESIRAARMEGFAVGRGDAERIPTPTDAERVSVSADTLERLRGRLPGEDEGWGNLDMDDIVVDACALMDTARPLAPVPTGVAVDAERCMVDRAALEAAAEALIDAGRTLCWADTDRGRGLVLTPKQATAEEDADAAFAALLALVLPATPAHDADAAGENGGGA